MPITPADQNPTKTAQTAEEPQGNPTGASATIPLLNQVEAAVLDTLGDGVVILDRQQHILFQNRPHRSKYGNRLGKLCFQAVHGRDAVCEGCPVRECFGTGEIRVRDREVLRGDETWHVEITASPIYENGEILAVIEIVRDITDRKKLEAEMLKTEKLESLGILAGGIAHDFNNMLTAIQGNLSLAENLLGGGNTATDLIKEAGAVTTHARNLAKQLLTFAKGGQPVKKMLSLPELITSNAKFVLHDSEVRCDFHIAEDLHPISGDEGQLAHVVQNLVLNAEQAMGGRGVIRITAENVARPSGSQSPKAGTFVRIRVVDQGSGIAKEHLTKIFDPYFTTKKKGRGLGLASAHSVITQHGGALTVDSEPGKGATFTVLLPALGLEGGRVEEGSREIRPGKGRVLVMDDEEHVRTIAIKMLARLGFQPEGAKDGSLAIDFYKQAKEKGAPFDAVLMDLTIPGGMGGKETIAELLRYDPGIKAIVSSGYTNDDVLANYKLHGFRGMLPKPYGLTELSKALSEVLENA
ncbi:MAG: ATP-binding protein [Desulfobacteraceae bacterium]|nr:ATP-binding protein [Desulfobacteraceae bacterium]